MTIDEFLQLRGYHCADRALPETAVWRQWYLGHVDTFHQYSIYNGRQHVECRKLGLGMGKQVCEDWANILFNEQVRIIAEDPNTHSFLNEVLQYNNAFERINQKQEEKMYAGTVAYIPYAEKVCADPYSKHFIGGGKIRINCVSGANILPLHTQNGECIECAFTSHIHHGNQQYTHLQMCIIAPDTGFYAIENHLFAIKGTSEEKVPLATLTRFAHVLEVYHTGSATKPFALDRPALANPERPNSAHGVSVFASSLPILQAIDTIFDSYVNEFILGKKRVIVTAAGARTMDGMPVFDPSDIAYYQLPEDMGENPFLKEIDMRLRTQEHQRALDDMLQLLSTRCGFGPDNFKYTLNRTAVTKTATEILSQKQTKQQTREKHLKVLDRALRELVHAIIDIGIHTLGLPLNPKTPIRIEHDDAVIESRETRLARMRADTELGLIKPSLYLMEAYGVNEKEALAMMP